MGRAADPPKQPPGPSIRRARNLPYLGRSAAQDEPQQPLTSDGPPLDATARSMSFRPRGQDNGMLSDRGSITIIQLH
jgi:hypothetical protein